MRLGDPAAILIAGILALLGPVVSCAQQSDQTYELHGKVLNSATGAGVANALVQLTGTRNHVQVQFSGSDGAFAFAELPAGDYQITATKPGFFGEAEVSNGLAAGSQMQAVPSGSEAHLNLAPEGVIYGRVENDAAQAFDGVRVRVQRWVVSGGSKQLNVAGTALTDDEGQFRIAGLKPGTYYLEFVPGSREGFRTFGVLAKKSSNLQGYGSQYYPAAPDLSSATAIRIRAGSQVQITQKMRPQRLFEVAGFVHGASPEKGFQLTLTNSAGDPIQKNTHLDQKTGEFQIAGVPEGTYLLTATAQAPGSDGREEQPQLTAMMPIHVAADLTGLGLQLGRGASIDVTVDHEFSSGAEATYRIEVTLTFNEFQRLSRGLSLPSRRDSDQPARFEGVAPGTYEVFAFSFGRGYIASLQSGDVDLLRDDLTVAAGASVPPIEVTLRDDGAEVTIETANDGQRAAANIVLYSEDYPKQSIALPKQHTGKVSIGNLRPGAYRIAAFAPPQDVEFRDPQFAEKYLAGAREINLKPGDKVSVQLEVQSIQDE